MSRPLNAKNRPFSWSFSRWKDFDTCPWKYACASFYCTLPYKQSDAAIWGDRVHKAAELFLKGVPHPDIDALLPVEDYCTKMIRTGHRIHAEMEIVLDKDMNQVMDWFSKKACLRVKTDVTILKSKKEASLYDWKTGGKVRHEDAQLELNALALMTIMKKLEEVQGRYIWTQHKKVTPIVPVRRENYELLWEKWLARAHRMEEAWRTENFPARGNALCGWCEVPNCKARTREFVGGK